MPFSWAGVRFGGASGLAVDQPTVSSPNAKYRNVGRSVGTGRGGVEERATSTHPSPAVADAFSRSRPPGELFGGSVSPGPGGVCHTMGGQAASGATGWGTGSTGRTFSSWSGSGSGMYVETRAPTKGDVMADPTNVSTAGVPSA